MTTARLHRRIREAAARLNGAGSSSVVSHTRGADLVLLCTGLRAYCRALADHTGATVTLAQRGKDGGLNEVFSDFDTAKGGAAEACAAVAERIILQVDAALALATMLNNHGINPHDGPPAPAGDHEEAAT